jgi:DNA polymerase I
MPTHLGRESRLFVAIDANSLVHRAFHAFPPDLATTDGIQVNAVYGFTSMLLRVLDELDPKYLVCAFDMKEPTFRHTEFVEYKGTRKPTDHTLSEQFPLVKEVLNAFNVPILERKGFEADDILATIAEYVQEGKWNGGSLELIIVTGDKDLLQVAGGPVNIWLPRGSFKDMELYGAEEVKRRFGFGPEFIPDFKGLVGDASDNIPGVDGIGEKSATEFIQTYGHLEELFKNLGALKEKHRKMLVEGEESAVMSRRLATVVRTVELDVKLEDCLMRDFDRNDVLKVFQRFEFRSLINKIPHSVNDSKSAVQMGIFAVGSGDSAGDPVKPAKGHTAEVQDLDLFVDSAEELGSAAMLFLDGGAVMAGVPNKRKQYSYYYDPDISDPKRWGLVKEFLMRGNVALTTYGWETLWRLVIDQCTSEEKLLLCEKCKDSVFDVGLAAYQGSSGQKNYTLKNLSFTYAGLIFPEERELLKSDTAGSVKAVVDIATSLRENKRNTIGVQARRNGKPIDGASWKSIDMPLSIIVADMSSRGVGIDLRVLEEKRTKLEGEIASVEKMIYESIGHEFNINSNKQLADVLFVELDLPVQRRKKTGPSTDENVLRKLKSAHPCIESILVYRERMKMLNTYVEPLIRFAKNSKDGRIHSTFRQTGTSTGRLSSDSPNLQNIPIRSELGKEIRDMFVAGPGSVLISVDYSQIDLRVIAAFSKDNNMVEDFKRKIDFHSATAARIFGKVERDVSENERRIAKTINFGVLYGLSAFGLSETLGIEREDAAAYINSYFEKYSGVQSYLEASIKAAQENGYVETVLGRRRYISSLRSDNRIVKAASEREAINMPVQGTSADVMRAAMVDIYKYILEKHPDDVSLVLQIHDEFLIESERSIARRVAVDVKSIMESALVLPVPLECAIEVGSSLASMEKIS